MRKTTFSSVETSVEGKTAMNKYGVLPWAGPGIMTKMMKYTLGPDNNGNPLS